MAKAAEEAAAAEASTKETEDQVAQAEAEAVEKQRQEEEERKRLEDLEKLLNDTDDLPDFDPNLPPPPATTQDDLATRINKE